MLRRILAVVALLVPVVLAVQVPASASTFAPANGRLLFVGQSTQAAWDDYTSFAAPPSGGSVYYEVRSGFGDGPLLDLTASCSPSSRPAASRVGLRSVLCSGMLAAWMPMSFELETPTASGWRSGFAWRSMRGDSIFMNTTNVSGMRTQPGHMLILTHCWSTCP
jgi:hypothetical protein